MVMFARTADCVFHGNYDHRSRGDSERCRQLQCMRQWRIAALEMMRAERVP